MRSEAAEEFSRIRNGTTGSSFSEAGKALRWSGGQTAAPLRVGGLFRVRVKPQ